MLGAEPPAAYSFSAEAVIVHVKDQQWIMKRVTAKLNLTRMLYVDCHTLNPMLLRDNRRVVRDQAG